MGVRLPTLILVDGRTLDHGDEFTIKGEGRFSFRYGWRTSGVHGTEVTCWGPVNSQQAAWRTFPASAVGTIHRTTKQHPNNPQQKAKA